jgi:hypothetical protein
MTRPTTWSNSDSLVVGYGPNIAERLVAGVQKDAGAVKTAKLQFTWESTMGASGAKITVPAGAAVKTVWMKVGTAWLGGTSLAFGDGSGTGSWITATQGALANLTLNTTINAQGAYAYTATEGQLPPKVYAAATDLYITKVGTMTAGTAEIYVEYV